MMPTPAPLGTEAIHAAGLAVNERNADSTEAVRQAVPRATEAASAIKSHSESTNWKTGRFTGLPIATFQNWLYEMNRQWKFTDGTLCVLWCVEFPDARSDYAEKLHYVASTRTEYNSGRHQAPAPAEPSVAFDRSGNPLIRGTGSGSSHTGAAAGSLKGSAAGPVTTSASPQPEPLASGRRPESLDIASDAGLREACQPIRDGDADWNRRLAAVLEWWSGLTEAERADRDNQQRLWEDNHVAAVGQGRIPIERALDDPEFRAWLAQRSMQPMPNDWDARADFLEKLHDDLRDQVMERLEDSARPMLKIFRVMAVLYPTAMTTVAAMGALHELGRAMGEPRKLYGAQRQVWVRRRVDEVLGPVAPGWEAQAARMTLPWLLLERNVRRSADKTEKVQKPGIDTKLQPLPAARRRRGLTAIRGLFPALLSTLEFVRPGVSRDELLDFLRSNAPDSKTTSLGVTINSYQGELDAIRSIGGLYVLTERGEDVLETQDPSFLADWLLTRILGIDRALTELRDHGTMPRAALLAAVHQMNPGWTSTFAPSAQLSWLLSMKVIQFDSREGFSLTDRGRQWADRIHWTPEPLEDTEDTNGPGGGVTVVGPSPSVNVVLPPLPAIVEAIAESGHFPAGLVANLHAGLWAHPRRHFAVLTGLSGSGKTLLARAYAAALAGDEHAEAQTLTLPVQPGWYDPGALLGYINPLRSESYVRTGFLEFLLRAAANPTRPHVVVLDEMNLSHPEQYMAPLLSAMETGDGIRLHAEDDVFDGVPRTLPYPPNLVLIGTVNMDETTHGLSDKVLDRAFVLEHWDVDLDGYPRWSRPGLESAQVQKARAVLADLMAALSPVRLHFGYRVVDTVFDYLVRITADGSGVAFHEALDFVVYAKVLPKLRGEDSSRLRAALETCEGCLEKHALTRSRSKVQELRADLHATGSARFWR